MKNIASRFVNTLLCDAFLFPLFAASMMAIYTALMFFSASERAAEVEKLESHIEYLEEYIEENHLPTPAMRIEE